MSCSRIFLHVLALLIPLSISGKQILVCSTCVPQSIRSAIEIAEDGDTVIVEKGVYHENGIVVNKSITLLGRGMPVIDGELGGEIITVISNNVTIEGFDIRNVGTSFTEDRAGIRIRNSRHFTIRGNRLLNTFFGIYIEHARDGEIVNNEVTGDATHEMSSGNAIHLWYCKRVTISQNLAHGHRDGIYLEFVDNSTVTNNTSSGNIRYGLHFMFSNDDMYTDNLFTNNGAGVAVMFSKNIKMHRNTFEDNWGPSSYGLLLKEIYDAEISNCHFEGNSIGIYVEGSTRIDYRYNTFKQNGWAIKISGGCLDNTVRDNNFIANTFDLSLNSKSNNNTFNGNFWSAYTGYDLDRNGIGDVPYRPVKLFNYIVNQTPETIVLLRSLFIDIVNFSEKVSPVFTPREVMDKAPKMRRLPFPVDSHVAGRQNDLPHD